MTPGRSPSPMALSAQALSVSVGAVEVLQGVDVAIPAGQWTSVVGPNGAGKSTLLRALAGLQAHSGQVVLLGRALNDWGRRERACALSWLGQNESVADDVLVYDIAMLGRMPHQPWLGAPSVADHAAVEQALRSTQAWEWRHRSLGGLSGGERQRVLLARALAVQAQVLLMDEPLANLDPPHQADWLAQVRTLVAAGKTVVSVLHEISVALQADRLLLLRAGQVVHQGASEAPETHRALELIFENKIGIQRFNGKHIALLK
jgi:iron complex transport system ATP-binding protein